MSALGLGMALSKAGITGRIGIGPLAVTASDQSLTLSWPSVVDEPDEWIIWFNVTNNYGTAIKLYAGGTITGAETSKTISTTNNADITPLAAGVLITGTKYYFWLTKGDGAGNAIGNPATAQIGRSFITILKGAITTTLRVPYDLTPATAAGGSEELGMLFFGTTTNAPIGFSVTANATTYNADGSGSWEDGSTGDPANAAIISGAFGVTLANVSQAPASFTFWNI